ncbi:hypothetical protein JOB18_031450 [Solea senegalensis]|uniref:Uncharacterized protein n=1 Tax=Solea senegalensis TaxID=28829 RepID=A0AAV6RU28_SOLSE|nr:hypothetical protein JOB18_031450 [Solea senegalensis]
MKMSVFGTVKSGVTTMAYLSAAVKGVWRRFPKKHLLCLLAQQDTQPGAHIAQTQGHYILREITLITVLSETRSKKRPQGDSFTKQPSDKYYSTRENEEDVMLHNLQFQVPQMLQPHCDQKGAVLTVIYLEHLVDKSAFVDSNVTLPSTPTNTSFISHYSSNGISFWRAFDSVSLTDFYLMNIIYLSLIKSSLITMKWMSQCVFITVTPVENSRLPEQVDEKH